MVFEGTSSFDSFAKIEEAESQPHAKRFKLTIFENKVREDQLDNEYSFKVKLKDDKFETEFEEFKLKLVRREIPPEAEVQIVVEVENKKPERKI